MSAKRALTMAGWRVRMSWIEWSSWSDSCRKPRPSWKPQTSIQWKTVWLMLQSEWHAFPAKNEAQALALIRAFGSACRCKALIGLKAS